MIIRILGEGQFDVDASRIDALNTLDAVLEKAVADDDEAAFGTALAALLDGVRTSGKPVGVDELVDSELFLPPADASLHEVADLLGDEGLIPG